MMRRTISRRLAYYFVDNNGSNSEQQRIPRTVRGGKIDPAKRREKGAHR